MNTSWTLTCRHNESFGCVRVGMACNILRKIIIENHPDYVIINSLFYIKKGSS